MKVANSDNRMAFNRCSGTLVPSETKKKCDRDIIKICNNNTNALDG